MYTLNRKVDAIENNKKHCKNAQNQKCFTILHIQSMPTLKNLKVKSIKSALQHDSCLRIFNIFFVNHHLKI